MKKVAAFCIPAHGHTNPMLPVVRELSLRGDEVRFYSFSEFQKKIERTGATFVCCDKYLPELSTKQEENLKKVSTTEMTIQDIRITASMDEFLHGEFTSFKPDIVYTDSVCFWGKLNAWKYDVPMVVSTSTFAFNQMSSTYLKNTPREMAGLIFGLPRVSRELNKLKAYGYKAKGLFSLIQSDNQTDSVVYTSKKFQPYAESFSDHYIFVGPSLLTDKEPDKRHVRPLVYISLGTVINDRPDFYSKCIEAFKDENIDVIISCGKSVDIASFGKLPENIKVEPYVDQLDVLSRADVFITHCGMNSVSESLYMATPMVLYAQTNEQEAADFIDNAPHSSNGVDIIRDLSKANVGLQVGYSIVTILLANILFRIISIKYLWIYIVLAIVLSPPINKLLQKAVYKHLVKTRLK